MSSVEISKSDRPEAAPGNHGRTRSAWVANSGVVVGALFAGWGFTVWDMVWVWIGSGVAVAALIAAGVLKALGHGQPSR